MARSAGLGTLLGLALLAGSASSAPAQQDTASIAGQATLVSRLLAGAEVALQRQLDQLLEHPERLNEVLGRAFPGNERWRLLKDLKLRFTTFEATKGDRKGLGLAYTYAKDIKRQSFSQQGVNQTGLGLSVRAEGNIAFERRFNPRDFLKSAVVFDLFHTRGGAVRTSDEDARKLNDLQLQLTALSREELRRSPVLTDFLAIMTRHLSTQVYLEAAASGGLESDQSFDHTQYTAGGSLGLDLKAWDRGSALAQWNLFDWPFAAIRYLTGTDQRFTPRGSTIPTLRVGFELVDPDRNPERLALGATGMYPRIQAEAAMKSLLAELASTQLFFESGLRYYRELGATAAVQNAGLDSFTYFAMAVAASAGPFASYSVGRLPFDAAKDHVFELGFKLHF